VQIVIQGDLLCWAVPAMGMGCSNDAGLYGSSQFAQDIEDYMLEALYLVVDSGYGLTVRCQSPFTNICISKLPPVQRAAAIAYNALHRRVRNCIECYNGILKNRFRIMLHGTTFRDPQTYYTCAMACIILNNICTLAKLPIPEIDASVDYSNPNAITEIELHAGVAHVTVDEFDEFFRVHPNIDIAKHTAPSLRAEARRIENLRQFVKDKYIGASV
jgi:hypothetical protein